MNSIQIPKKFMSQTHMREYPMTSFKEESGLILS